MSKAVIKKKHLQISNQKYYTALAENVRLGTFGIKKTSPIFTNYLDGQGHIPLEGIDITKPSTVEIDFEKSKSVDFGAEASYKVANAPIGFTYEGLKQGRLVLMKLIISSNIQLRNLINQDETILQEILSYKNPRIVNQIFVIVEASFASEFTSRVSFKASANQGLLTVDASAEVGSSNKSSLIISEGTVYAYGMLKPDFDKPKSKITLLHTDQWGAG